MIIDITQEITTCKVYEGDPTPKVKILKSMNDNELYNLSEFSMCAHNGTHIDAPAHFIKEGKTVDQIPLDRFVGECYISEFNGNLEKDDAIRILEEAKGIKRILIKGNCVVESSGASVFASSDLLLIGIEGQSFGPEETPLEVHKILLSKEIVLLEGVVLKNVNMGKYYLCAQPLNIKGIEGSPCRAILIDKLT